MKLALSPIQKTLYKELYKKSLYDFVKDFWETCDPSKFVDGFIIQFYCECFQYFCRSFIPCQISDVKIPAEYKNWKVIDVRENKQNLNINVPPRHSKSMIFNVLGPVWLWINLPIKAASISHTNGLSKSMNAKRQKILNSEKFKYFFGDEIKLTANTSELLIDNRSGELYSKCRDSLTGFGADLIINDDLTNAETARKDKQEMASAWAYYRNTMPSRLNNISTGVIINIMQRLAPNDITGHILAEPKLRNTYSFIILPAIFQENSVVICPISGDIFVFKKNTPLWPERFGNYEALRSQVGESVFQTQYLQEPIATDRTIIKPNMIIEKSLVEIPELDQADMIYASHDFPVKDKDKSDFFGSIVAYRCGSMLYIKECLEKKMAFVKSVEYVKQLDSLFPGIIQIVEDKANGSPILQQLRDQVAGMQAYQPGTKSKIDRLDYCTTYLSAGNIIFIKSNFDTFTKEYTLSEDLENLKRRLINFPFVEHDDIVDAFSQLILYVYMDKRFQVYGKSFNDLNIIKYAPELSDYSTVFFSREGDLWKVAEIVIRYGLDSKLIVIKDWSFKETAINAIENLKKFAPTKSVFINCSIDNSLYDISNNNIIIEPYVVDNFEESVYKLNLAFDKKQVLLDKSCKQVKADIEAFKYEKTDSNGISKFKTESDGFVTLIRTAIKYYGI